MPDPRGTALPRVRVEGFADLPAGSLAVDTVRDFLRLAGALFYESAFVWLRGYIGTMGKPDWIPESVQSVRCDEFLVLPLCISSVEHGGQGAVGRGNRTDYNVADYADQICDGIFLPGRCGNGAVTPVEHHVVGTRDKSDDQRGDDVLRGLCARRNVDGTGWRLYGDFEQISDSDFEWIWRDAKPDSHLGHGHHSRAGTRNAFAHVGGEHDSAGLGGPRNGRDLCLPVDSVRNRRGCAVVDGPQSFVES